MNNFEALRTLNQLPRREEKIKERIYDAPWPTSLDEDAMHGLAGEIVNEIDPHTESDKAAILIQLLSAFGNVVGRCGHFAAEADRHHTNLFTVLVGDTAKGRKGTSFGHIKRLFETVDEGWTKNNVKSGLSSGEGLIWHVRDASRDEKGEIGDNGIIDKRLLVVESEFANVLRVVQREGNTLSPVVRDAWDGGALSTLTKNKPARATEPHISIIGHITKTELKKYLSATESANGFGNRFLWVCVKRSKILPNGGRFHLVDSSHLVTRIQESVCHARLCSLLERDAEASAIWDVVYPILTEGLPGLLGAMTGRREAQVMRIAVIYALLDKANAITVEHLKAALAVEQYCMESCRHIFGFNLGDPIADKILERLMESPEGLTRTDISHTLFNKNKGQNEINHSLALLRDNNLAHSISEPTGGRATERWFAGISDPTTLTKETTND